MLSYGMGDGLNGVEISRIGATSPKAAQTTRHNRIDTTEGRAE